MKELIPKPTVERLCRMYRILEDAASRKIDRLSSREIGEQLGASAHTVRKDISFLGDASSAGASYETARLFELIKDRLSLSAPRRVCVVGLGRLGESFLQFELFSSEVFSIVAGFDSSTNRLETIRTAVKLYRASEIPEVVRGQKIELALLAVPPDAAQLSVDRLVEGGIRGIVNYTPAMVSTKNENVFISHVDALSEMRILSAFVALS